VREGKACLYTIKIIEGYLCMFFSVTSFKILKEELIVNNDFKKFTIYNTSLKHKRQHYYYYLSPFIIEIKPLFQRVQQLYWKSLLIETPKNIQFV